MLRNEIIAPFGARTDVFRPLSEAASMPQPLGNTGDSDNPRRRELRNFCRRLYGWSAEQDGLVDEATENMLGAAERCGVIALRGDGDLVPVAYALHCKLVGPDRPFMLCDPRRAEREGSVRFTANRKTSAAALSAGAGGSVCVRSNHLPDDHDLLAPSRRMLDGTQLFVCLTSDDPVVDVLCPPIRIMPLAHRTDLHRLVGEYLADATHALGVGRMRISKEAYDALLSRTATLADLEKIVARVVALKSTPNISVAAQRLGMARVSLDRWASRRDVPAILAAIEWDRS